MFAFPSVRQTALRRWTLLASTLFISMVIPRPAAAQLSSSNLRGTITDPSGAVVASTTVNATSRSTGFVRSATSTEDGQYSLSDLPPGVYDLSAESSGFKKVIIQ